MRHTEDIFMATDFDRDVSRAAFRISRIAEELGKPEYAAELKMAADAYDAFAYPILDERLASIVDRINAAGGPNAPVTPEQVMQAIVAVGRQLPDMQSTSQR